MFIDELTLNIWAGKGGDGIVSWMHVKGLSHAGPGGGDGGKGGSVYLQGVHDIGALSRHRFIKDFNADNPADRQGIKRLADNERILAFFVKGLVFVGVNQGYFHIVYFTRGVNREFFRRHIAALYLFGSDNLYLFALIHHRQLVAFGISRLVSAGPKIAWKTREYSQ